jgi:hypothetical protein
MQKDEFAALDAALVDLFGVGLLPEQLQCLTDAGRAREAAEMLDDMAARMGVNPAVVEVAKSKLGSSAERTKEDIERALQAHGFRMEHSLAVFDGGGHALIEISTGDMVDPPNEEILALAIAWTAIESPHAYLDGDGSDVDVVEHYRHLDDAAPATPTLASQWGASPGKMQCTGPIVALSDLEVIQGAGRGMHVVWDRRKIPDHALAVGESVTIHEGGAVTRKAPDQGLGR